MGEAILWWLHYKDWNNVGERRRPLFLAALLCSVFKVVYSYRLLLVVALGSGVTCADLAPCTYAKVHGLTIVFLMFDFLGKSVLAYKYSHALSRPFLLTCQLPSALTTCVIFFWLFMALANSTEQLHAKQDVEP